MSFGCSKEPSQEVVLSTHNIMFWLRNKEIIFSLGPVCEGCLVSCSSYHIGF